MSSFFALMGLQIQGRGNTGNTQRFWMKVIGKDDEQTGKHKKILDTGRRKNSMRRLRGGLCSIIRFPIKRFHVIKQNPLQPKLLLWTPRSVCVPLMRELKHQPVSFSWWTWAYVLSSFFMLPVELDLLSWGNSWSHSDTGAAFLAVPLHSHSSCGQGQWPLQLLCALYPCLLSL